MTIYHVLIFGLIVTLQSASAGPIFSSQRDNCPFAFAPFYRPTPLTRTYSSHTFSSTLSTPEHSPLPFHLDSPSDLFSDSLSDLTSSSLSDWTSSFTFKGNSYQMLRSPFGKKESLIVFTTKEPQGPSFRQTSFSSAVQRAEILSLDSESSLNSDSEQESTQRNPISPEAEQVTKKEWIRRCMALNTYLQYTVFDQLKAGEKRPVSGCFPPFREDVIEFFGGEEHYKNASSLYPILHQAMWVRSPSDQDHTEEEKTESATEWLLVLLFEQGLIADLDSELLEAHLSDKTATGVCICVD